MAFEVVTSNPGTIYEVDEQDIVVLPVGQLFTSITDGFDANPSVGQTLGNVTLQIFGSIHAAGRAIDFWGSLGGLSAYNSSTIFVGSTGIVSGVGEGILAESGSGNQILNHGLISGSIGIDSYGGPNSVIRNSGTITGLKGQGILVEGEVDTAGNPNAVITNLTSGLVSGTLSAIRLENLVGGSSITNHGTIYSALGLGIDLTSVSVGQSVVRVVNHGMIEGGAGSYSGSDNGDSLVNRGVLVGDVLMGGGNDQLDTRTGRIDGDFDAGAGNDTVMGNAALGENLVGGADSDTLGFRSGGAVTVALDGSIDNGGAALGDTYTGFENVNGSAFGDRIIGSNAVNRLSGGGANDTLTGGGGDDVLIGNRGADVLSGETGSDAFVFNALGDIGDTISDFGSGAGNNDILHLSAADFGAGLIAGSLAAAQYRARADNVAQDSDDLFIFRTTDATLWFDADGNGVGEAVMVANLQDTAIFARADILLI